MAKRNANQKAKQKALRNARKDGKVSGKEAAALRDLGISKRQITSTKAGSVKIGRNVAAAKPAPAPASKQPASPSQKIANFSQDGEISKREARQLANSGVTLQDLKFNSSATLGAGAQNTLRQPVLASQAASKADNNAERTAAYKDPTGLGISRKDLFAMQAQAMQGPQKWSTGETDPDQGRYPNEGGINYAMYGGKEYQGQQKTSGGAWGKVAKKLGIRTIDNEKDLARMFNFVNGASTGVTRGSGSGGNGKSELADRTSGEFDDIKAALGEDQQSGLDAAAELDARPVAGNEALGDSYLDIINSLITQQGSTQGSNQGSNQADIDSKLAGLDSSFTSSLAAQSAQSAASLGQLNDLFTTQFSGIQSQMALQQQDFKQAQAFSNQQLASANAALLAEQQRSANLGNAYIPQSNPNAMSIGYGDGRSTKRRDVDNQLSDLTLMSGLGTQSNPLAGLQLA